MYTAPRAILAAGCGGWLAVSVNREPAWIALCKVLERCDWTVDPELATPAGRNRRGDEIEAVLAAWAASTSADEAAAALQAAGVAAAPVVSGAGLVNEPHLTAVGAWMRIERRHVGLHLMAAPPYRVDGVRPPITRPAPLLGEHTAEVLGDLKPA